MVARKYRITETGKYVRRKLKEMGVNQKEFCELHGIDPARFSDLINGRRKCLALGKKVSEILDSSNIQESNQ